jgi:glycosyltransferase involved in cell wall biosynthesis
MDAIGETWPGAVTRIDLLDRSRAEGPRPPTPGEVVRFSSAALWASARRRPDVVLCGLVGLLPVAFAAAGLRGQRPALLAYGMEVWASPGAGQRLMIRRCSAWLTPSRYTAVNFSAQIGIPAAQMKIVTLPVPSILAERARAEPVPPESREAIVLTVSRLARSDRFKGHFDVAQAMPAVLRAKPAARWIIVGDGDDREALTAECRRLDIAHAVTFTGRISDEQLGALYERAAIVALPSVASADAQPPIGEGFGIAYAEAGAFAVPSVASSNGGGAEEFVTDGVTGLTVPPHDTGALAATIVRLLDDPVLRARLGLAARRRALTRHDPGRYGPELARLLEPPRD